MKKSIRFIINPRSGIHSKSDLPSLIRTHLDHDRFDSEFRFTEYAGHATELSREGKEQGFDIIAVAGGDGSMNEAAAPLLHSGTALALIPCGSGNGLARHLGIPMDIPDSIRLIGSGEIRTIDTFTAGPHQGVGTFGIGFDAHIAHLFAKSPKRGYGTYVRLVLSEFSSFPPFDITMCIDGKTISDRLFLMTFANSSQFGNNAVIAPGADISDGLIDLAMVRPFPWYSAPNLIYRLTANSLDRSRFYRHARGNRIEVQNPGELRAHIDGEPVVIKGDFNVALKSRSLKIIVPSGSLVGTQ